MMSQFRRHRNLPDCCSYRIGNESSETTTALESPLPPSSSSPTSSSTHLNRTCLNRKRRAFTKARRLSARLHQKLSYSAYFNASPLILPWDRLKVWLGTFPVNMAEQDPRIVSSVIESPADEFMKKKNFGQQKREELEREVCVLHKMLEHEQKVHRYLDAIHARQDTCPSTIPHFLPLNMKELVAELAMVDNEIIRLESQISQLHDHSTFHHSTTAHRAVVANESGRRILKNRHHQESMSVLPDQEPNNDKEESNNAKKVTFDTKTLHFISKAMQGDHYNMSNDKFMDSKSFSSGSKENVGFLHERVSKRSGIKAPSPLRELRNPTPRKHRNVGSNIAEISSPKGLSKLHESHPPAGEDNLQKLSPNKLSENIMKCLLFIYVRLLRTSRAMDMEKSGGSVTRCTDLSMSFRSDSKAFLTMSQKDSRQQDPYGVFASEESLPRDIGPYKNLVRFTSSCIDLKCIQSSNSIPLFQKLKVLMGDLEKVDLRLLNHQQKLAFWINVYNACIMHGFVQYGVPTDSSPEKLLTLINKSSLIIAGSTINAREIEHYILKNSGDSPVKEMIGKTAENNKKEMRTDQGFCGLGGLETPEPNIVFALCSGTRSSPAVKIYTSDGVIGELERSKLEYLQAAMVVTRSKRIGIPELVLRHCMIKEEVESLVEWICQQLPTSGSLRKSIVECLRGKPASAIVDKIPSQFDFQYLLPV